MSSSYTSIHFDGTEPVRLDGRDNHVSLYIGGRGSHELGIVLPHSNGAEVNAAFLRNLAAAALNLAVRVEQAADAEAVPA
jgi:hypothetical protein